MLGEGVKACCPRYTSVVVILVRYLFAVDGGGFSFLCFFFLLTLQGLPRGAGWDVLRIRAIQKSLHYSDSISSIQDFHSASRKESVEQSSAVLQSMVFL